MCGSNCYHRILEHSRGGLMINFLIKDHSIELLNRFGYIAPQTRVLNKKSLVKLVNVAFRIVGYDAHNLGASVDRVLENSQDFGFKITQNSEIENPENLGNSEIDFSQNFRIENLENLGYLFYQIWRVDL